MILRSIFMVLRSRGVTMVQKRVAYTIPKNNAVNSRRISKTKMLNPSFKRQKVMGIGMTHRKK